MTMIKKILIANRGEIACRVIRTARALAIPTVAVYSDADQHALHVRLADEAVRIGPAPARDSYLNPDNLIAAAHRTGADAIHPGYGFLSENANFAAACDEADIIFIGPPAPAIKAMGSKSAAKAIMADADVPLLSGYHGDDQTAATLKAAAEDVGYPVLLKASAGGGGKGMRIVAGEADFDEAFQATQRESLNAFGDDHLLVERYVENPRHVEVQVFCDEHGQGVYVGDRDCSIQRRHQKVIEEAPAPGLDDKTRARMGAAAVACARAIGYVGAGTVEFLLDEDESFYFMEMNTRLQVEHPVTELVTGQDLVAWQIHVAQGGRLPLTQNEIRTRGHAVEARLYAEDPDQNFLPATGFIEHLAYPPEVNGLRIDNGIQVGDHVDVYYDPMLAKVIAYGETRELAIRQLILALQATQIAPLTTNIDYLARILRQPEFHRADLSTRFIERHAAELARPDVDKIDLAIAAYLLSQWPLDQAVGDPWGSKDGWWLNDSATTRLELAAPAADATHEACVRFDAGSTVAVDIGSDNVTLVVASLTAETVATNYGTRKFWTDGLRLHLFDPAATFTRVVKTFADDHDTGFGIPEAPMNGTIVAIVAEIGAQVEPGDALIIMEAMKMEHTVRATQSGTVRHYRVGEGDMVTGGQVLVDLDLEEQD